MDPRTRRRRRRKKSNWTEHRAPMDGAPKVYSDYEYEERERKRIQEWEKMNDRAGFGIDMDYFKVNGVIPSRHQVFEDDLVAIHEEEKEYGLFGQVVREKPPFMHHFERWRNLAYIGCWNEMQHVEKCTTRLVEIQNHKQLQKRCGTESLKLAVCISRVTKLCTAYTNMVEDRCILAMNKDWEGRQWCRAYSKLFANCLQTWGLWGPVAETRHPYFPVGEDSEGDHDEDYEKANMLDPLSSYDYQEPEEEWYQDSGSDPDLDLDYEIDEEDPEYEPFS